MAIKTIPLSRLEANLKTTLNECADSGQTVVVEMPVDMSRDVLRYERGADGLAPVS